MASLFQFSVRGLLYAVTFLAVGIAALANANGLWQGLMWGAALYALTAATLLIVYRRQEKRAFWLGFAVFGWAYVCLVLTAQIPSLTQTWYRTDALKFEHLFATQAAQFAHQNLLPQARREPHLTVQAQQTGSLGGPGMAGPGGMPGGGDMSGMMMSQMAGGGPMSGMNGMGGSAPMGFSFAATVPNPDYVPVENFTQIFHALVLLLVAAMGGKTCQIIYCTRPKTEE